MSVPARPPRGGTGRATVEVVAGRSVVTACYATNPMKLLAPREPHRSSAPGSPGQPAAASVCVSGFGGGLLSGDHLALELDVRPGARLMLTTQASTKVFHARAEGRPASQTLEARVGEGGLLAALPDPVVCFRDAVYEQEQRFELQAGAGLVLLDILTAGRLNHGTGERWAFRRYASRNRVWLDGAEVLHDSMVLGGAGNAGRETAAAPEAEPIADALVTGGFDAFATLCFVGSAAEHPAVEAWSETVRGRRPGRGDASRTSVGRLGDSSVRVARFAAAGVEAIQKEVRQALACLPAMVGRGYGERKF